MTARCELYRHTHASVILNAHHVVPKSWFAGQPVRTPMATLCPNCHTNVHAAIDSLIRGDLRDGIPPRCVKLARLALALAASKGLTPRATL